MMSDELEKYTYKYVEERNDVGEIIYNNILAYPKEVKPAIRAEDELTVSEGRIRAIASEVGRENKVNHNGIVFIVILAVAFIVVMAMILVACQHQPVVISPPSQQPNCHFLCGG